MFMSKHSFKKISAAAIVAVLGVSAASHAATIISTGFETLPDGTTSSGYLPGGLTGQQGWVDFNGGSTGTATVTLGSGQTGLQGVVVNSTTAGYSEFYNNVTQLTPAQVNGGTVTTVFSVARQTPTGGQTTGAQPQSGSGPAEAGFGVEILNSTQTAVLASVFVRNTSVIAPGGPTPAEPSVPALFVQDASGVANTEIFSNVGAAASDGSYGTYTLTANFVTQMFTVSDAAGTSQSFPFAVAYDGNGIGGVTISADNEGNDTAFFDNFSVTAAVPEPVSLGLVVTGGVMLMSRRRREAAC